jgi:hypothetical protein
MEGPENETGAVDEEEMITFFHGSMDSVTHLQRPYKVPSGDARKVPNLSLKRYQFLINLICRFP